MIYWTALGRLYGIPLVADPTMLLYSAGSLDLLRLEERRFRQYFTPETGSSEEPPRDTYSPSRVA